MACAAPGNLAVLAASTHHQWRPAAGPAGTSKTAEEA